MLFLSLGKFVSLGVFLLVLGVVQKIMMFPLLIPIFLVFFVLLSKKDYWFWWLAFLTGCLVDLLDGKDLGKTSIIYLLFVLVLWWQWKKKKTLGF